MFFNSFDNYNLLKIVKIIESYLKKIKPIIVFTHNKHDLNIDHRITFESTLTACRPLNESSVKRLLCFEIASSTEWAFGSFSNSFKPNFFIDIEKNIKNKIKSLKFYKSELRKYLNKQTNKRASRQTNNKQRSKKANKQTNKQANKQTNKQTNEETN